MITDKIETLLANKWYDADALREELENAEVEIVILAKSNRREPIPQDQKFQHRLRQRRGNSAIDTVCPRNLAVFASKHRV